MTFIRLQIPENRLEVVQQGFTVESNVPILNQHKKGNIVETLQRIKPTKLRTHLPFSLLHFQS